MPTSAPTSLGFFGQFADVGIRAPEQNELLQQALIRGCSKTICSAHFVATFVERIGQFTGISTKFLRTLVLGKALYLA